MALISESAPTWVPTQTTNLAGHDMATHSRLGLAEIMARDCKANRPAGFSSGPRLVFDVNGHGLSLASTDADYRAAVMAADILHADGGFLVTLSKLRGDTPIAERSATTDLLHDFAARAEADGLTFYLLGATEAVNKACVQKLEALYPRLRIVGRRNGYFTEAEEAGVVDAINMVKPDVLWVGLGKPKEQYFSVRNAKRLNAGWLVTCGGCFNYVTGAYKRAPDWMQRTNLEWLHRMVTNPRQLFWRYLVTTPHALWLALKN